MNTVLGNLIKTEDPWDILFARAEGLYVHGHTREACILSVQLAEELLANPPNLMIDEPPAPVKGKKKKVDSLERLGFVCSIQQGPLFQLTRASKRVTNTTIMF